jgi:hypothetical protein
VIFRRKLTMQTRPNWTVIRYLGADDKIVPLGHRRARAKRFPYPVTAEISGAGHSGHISSADHPVRH